MAYVTLAEYTNYVQVAEGYIDDGDPDQGVIATVYQTRIDSASDYINSILGIRYAVPVPATALIKEICCQIAHYDGEKSNDARRRVFELYELAIQKLKCIADGEAVLLGLPSGTGAISVVPQLPGGGDASVGTPGIQKVGIHLSKRNYSTRLGKNWYPCCCPTERIPSVIAATPEDEMIVATQANHGFGIGTVIYYDGANYLRAINTSADTLGYLLVVQPLSANTFEIARSMQVVEGLSGLTPGAWYHTSVAVAGQIEPLSVNQSALPGAFAANAIGQAISTTALRFVSITPFQA
jgi:phage gp36-like protein